MSPAQWARLEDLFAQGCDDAEAQRRILDECAGDAVVQAELRRLWAHDSTNTEFLANPPMVDVSSSLSPNDVLAGRFTILERIGRGGMGEVYRARDERLRRIVAVKVLSPRLASDQTYRKRLEQEARVVSSLSHPAICPLHDLGSDGDLVFLVMEYVPGEALDARLKRGPLPLEQAASIALEICGGLQHAHANGLVHRDLKPANVMLSPHGVKLLDFGIACRTGVRESSTEAVAAETRTGLTAAGQILGTPAYMSPEQAQGKPVDTRSDVYSFGLMLREMLPDAVPARLQSVVGRCLEADPQQRFRSAAELADALKDATRRRTGRVRQWVAATAAAICGVVALGFWYTKAAQSRTGEVSPRVLTSYAGTEYFPTFSPDGHNIAFLWSGEQETIDLYVRPVDTDAPLRLTQHPDPERSPRWSPDGRLIAFAREGKAFVVSPFGGTERFVTELDHGAYQNCDVRLTWSGDSRRLLFPRPPGPGQAPAIHDIDLDTGAVRRLTTPGEGASGHLCPEMAPDGKQLLYRSVERGKQKLYVAELDGTGAIAAVREISWMDGWGHSWMPDSREVVFTRTLPGAALLFRSSVLQPNEPVRLPFGEEGMYPVISPKGGRMAYMRRRFDVEMWKAPLEVGQIRGEPFLSSSQPDAQAEYSPDGKQILFYSERGAKGEVWVADANGKHPRSLAPCDGRDSMPRWSPDGKFVVYAYRGDIYRVAVSGDSKPQVMVVNEAVETRPSYSRDGRWLYFTSFRTGAPELWRMPVEGGAATQITAQGVHFGVEAADGRSLYAVSKENGKDRLFEMSVAGGAMRKISPVALRPMLAVVADGLYFLAAESLDENPVLCFYEAKTQRVRQIGPLPHRNRGIASGLAISPDRKNVVYATYALQGDLMLVENFR
ncbi:MAG: serine/threonine-protein kinase [Bryobacterales bacterium]|nr:serine/threonine-protein kinase [Bryobacterales bacterium]